MNKHHKIDWAAAVTAARAAPGLGSVVLEASTVLALQDVLEKRALLAAAVGDAADAQRYRTVRASVTDKANGAYQIAVASEAVGVEPGQYPTPEQFDEIIDRVAIERNEVTS